LIEFPPTCEVRINGTQLTANLKGMKKKPGTAPPPNITSHANLNSLPNRVEMIYVNSQQPVTNKVCLVSFAK
jgi:E3 SUMO-protein ligase PIAS1